MTKKELLALKLKLGNAALLAMISSNPKEKYKELIADPAFDLFDRDKLMAAFEQYMNKHANVN